MKRLRQSIEDWKNWLHPYLTKHVFYRRKNQYDASMTRSYCYSVKSVPFKLMIEHKVSKYIKWSVSGVCIRCGTKFTSSWNNIWLKKAFRGLEVCGKCSRKEQFTDEWKSHNSETQKRIQGTPEARIRMSNILKKSWENDPNRHLRVSRSLKRVYENNIELRRKISEASRRNWLKPGHQEKVSGYGYHHGWYLSRCGKVYFASSWELMFLVWCDNSEDVIKFGRNRDAIPYEKPKEGMAFYHPDFDIALCDRNVVVEIKGGRSELGLVERKKEAADRFYSGSKDYMILYKDDLCRMGIFRDNRVVGRWISEMVQNGKVEGYGIKNKNIQWIREQTNLKERDRIAKIHQKSLSFNFPQILSEWDYEQNVVNPNEVSYGSEVVAFWKCSVCGHKWKSKLSSRTRKHPAGCIMCGRKRTSIAMKNRHLDENKKHSQD